MANLIDTDAKVITGDDYGFGHPTVIRLSDTVMLAGHVNGLNELEIHKSIDNGLNWTLKKTIASVNVAGKFGLIRMTSTKAGLVCRRTVDEKLVWISTDSGEAWTDKFTASTFPIVNDNAVLRYNSVLGRLYVAYEKSENKEYRYKSDNDGDSWTLSGGSQIYGCPVDGDIDYITDYNYWVQFDDGNYNAVHQCHEDGYYLDYYDYGTSGHTYHDKNFIIDSGGNKYFVYVDRTTATSKEKLVVSRNEGADVELYAPDTDDILVKGSSSIAMDNDDNVYVFYTKSANDKTYYRRYDAGTVTWESEVELIASANNRINTEKHILSTSNKLHYVHYRA